MAQPSAHLTIDVGTIRHGWCDICLLPSLASADMLVVKTSGVTLIGTHTVCTNEPHQR